VAHCWEKRLYTLPYGWASTIFKLLMDGMMNSKSETVFCAKLYQESAKCTLFNNERMGKGKRFSKLLAVMNLRTSITLRRLDCSSGFHLT
jgi:hypothetical protein